MDSKGSVCVVHVDVCLSMASPCADGKVKHGFLFVR